MLVATLIDLDAMDGKSSVSLLAECSSSPDVNTRYAFDIYIYIYFKDFMFLTNQSILYLAM